MTPIPSDSHSLPEDDEAGASALNRADEGAVECLDADGRTLLMACDTAAEFTDAERRRIAETQWLDALLHTIHRDPSEARERRIRRVMEELALLEPSGQPGGGDEARGISVAHANGAAMGANGAAHVVPVQQSVTGTTETVASRLAPPVSRRRTWIAQALTVASVLIGVVIFRNVTGVAPTALAAVETSLAEASEAPAREYQVTSNVRRPAGEREVLSTLVVQNRKFALKHPLPILPGSLWVGSNGSETWFVPPAGPVLVSKDERLLGRLVSDESLSTPILQVTTILERMKNRYEVELLPDATVHVSENPVRTVDVKVIRGTIREPLDFWPKTIELFARKRTGVAERLVLHWERSATALGPRRIVFALKGEPQVSADYFEHASHHGAARRVVGGE